MKLRKNACRFTNRKVWVDKDYPMHLADRSILRGFTLASLLLGLLVCSFGCRPTPDTQTANGIMIPSETSVDTRDETVFNDYRSDPSCNTLLIDIASVDRGMVNSPGYRTWRRVLREGEMEYDLVDQIGGTVRKQKKLTVDQTERLHKLIEKVQLNEDGSVYSIGAPCLDASFQKIVSVCPFANGDKRQILLNECVPLDNNLVIEPPAAIVELVHFLDGLV